MSRPEADWSEVQRRLLQGERPAFLRLNRLVSHFLVQLRAYDFEHEWDDLRQEVALAVVLNARGGRLRDPKAFVGYVRIVVRNKFIDRLRGGQRRHERDTLAWSEETARAVASDPLSAPHDRARELWSLVATLPDEQRQSLEQVYREGRTYEEAASALAVPLGTLKRRLRDAVETLRVRSGRERSA